MYLIFNKERKLIIAPLKGLRQLDKFSLHVGDLVEKFEDILNHNFSFELAEEVLFLENQFFIYDLEAEEIVLRNKQHLRNFFYDDSIPCFFDFKNFVYRFSGRKIDNSLGYSADEINNAGFNRFVLNMKKLSFTERESALLSPQAEKEYFQNEYKMKNKNGTAVFVTEFATKLKASNGMFIGHTGFWKCT